MVGSVSRMRFDDSIFYIKRASQGNVARIKRTSRSDFQPEYILPKKLADRSTPELKRVSVENQSKFVRYEASSHRPVRIVFGDGSFLVGVYVNCLI